MAMQILKAGNPRYAGQMVRLIDETGKGEIVDFNKAFSSADQQGLDLVLVVATATPPVVKIMNYGKFLYEEKKQEKKLKAAQQVKTKEVVLSYRIAEHDLQIKENQIVGFLNDNMNVKVIMKFSGREMAFKNMGKTVIDALVSRIETKTSATKTISYEDRSIVAQLSTKG